MYPSGTVSPHEGQVADFQDSLILTGTRTRSYKSSFLSRSENLFLEGNTHGVLGENDGLFENHDID